MLDTVFFPNSKVLNNFERSLWTLLFRRFFVHKR